MPDDQNDRDAATLRRERYAAEHVTTSAGPLRARVVRAMEAEAEHHAEEMERMRVRIESLEREQANGRAHGRDLREERDDASRRLTERESDLCAEILVLRERCARLERERDEALRLAKRREVDCEVVRSQRDGIDVALKHANDAYAKTAHEKHDALDRVAELEAEVERLRAGLRSFVDEWWCCLHCGCADGRDLACPFCEFRLLGPSPEGSPPVRPLRGSPDDERWRCELGCSGYTGDHCFRGGKCIWCREPPEGTETRTPTLAETMEGAERAAERVAKWPEWKRELQPGAETEREATAASTVTLSGPPVAVTNFRICPHGRGAAHLCPHCMRTTAVESAPSPLHGETEGDDTEPGPMSPETVALFRDMAIGHFGSVAEDNPRDVHGALRKVARHCMLRSREVENGDKPTPPIFSTRVAVETLMDAGLLAPVTRTTPRETEDGARERRERWARERPYRDVRASTLKPGQELWRLESVIELMAREAAHLSTRTTPDPDAEVTPDKETDDD